MNRKRHGIGIINFRRARRTRSLIYCIPTQVLRRRLLNGIERGQAGSRHTFLKDRLYIYPLYKFDPTDGLSSERVV